MEHYEFVAWRSGGIHAWIVGVTLVTIPRMAARQIINQSMK
jgi:hypothetical protein